MSAGKWIAAVAWVLLVIGLVKRDRRTVHVTSMLVAFALDFALVLYLQVTKDAVQRAVGFELSSLGQLHVLTSTVAILLYLPVFWLGCKLMRGSATPVDRRWHIRLALTAFIFRTLGFTLMFSVS